MNTSTIIQLIVAGIAFGTPMLFAALGELLGERSGVLNLGIEGMLLMGAVGAFWGARASGNVVVAILCAIAASSFLALIQAFGAVTLGVNQILLGLGLAIFGTGLSAYIAAAGDDPIAGQRAGVSVTPLLRHGPADWPIIGPILFSHDLLVYLSWLLVIATSFYLKRTRFGLAVRAVGSDPASADAAGLRVARIRYIHVLLGGVGSGLGGAYFALVLVPAWQDGLTAGAGWIVLAIVIVAQWRPWRVLVAAVLFGAATRLGFVLQLRGVKVPSEFLAMIPFVGAALAVVITRALQPHARSEPEALGLAFDREAR